MRRFTLSLCLLAMLMGVSASVYAELQSVEVGGELRIRGRHWGGGWAGTRFPGGRFNPYDPARFPGRSLGLFGISSLYDWDRRGPDRTFFEQRTAISVKANFSDDVTAFIELMDFAIWGEDFRSNYVTGVDRRAVSNDDIEVYQGYIEARNVFGQPIRLRVGRQEMVMGSGWLISNQISPVLGLSFDAVRLTYDTDAFSVDAFTSKLVEGMGDFFGDDVDLHGVYMTYKGYQPLNIGAYWFWVRDDREIDETPGASAAVRLAERIRGFNDYGTTHLHTVGLRLNGASSGFDYNLDVAYQFGAADQVGTTFKLFGPYGDTDAKFDHWAFDAEVGYTFDCAWSPRVFVGGAWYQGEDNRDVSFGEWLNPFRKPKASVSFNRLFSNIWYTASTDILGGAAAMSNFWQARTGVVVKPTESVTSSLRFGYFWADKTFALPKTFRLGGLEIPAPNRLSFWTEPSDDELMFSAMFWIRYNYTPDWFFTVGWERVFSRDGITSGNFIMKNGLEFSGGTGRSDADYIWFDTGIKF